MVKNTGNLVKNCESSNPPIRLSDELGDHRGNDFLASSSVVTYDDLPNSSQPSSSQARDASHGIGQDLVSKPRDAYDEYKHDDCPGSRPVGIVKISQKKRRKLTRRQGEDYYDLSHNRDYQRYDDRPSSSQTRDASHGIGQDLVSKSRDASNEYNLYLTQSSWVK
ncbi:hypothetical protein SUGI_0318400 [Cryptomeria japonica]|nr:hypothetical protein SUGI_0318400 [Cryptomeria japonica]